MQENFALPPNTIAHAPTQLYSSPLASPLSYPNNDLLHHQIMGSSPIADPSTLALHCFACPPPPHWCPCHLVQMQILNDLQKQVF